MTPRAGYQPNVSGQRRGLVESYYANIDFSSPADVRKLIAAYGIERESSAAGIEDHALGGIQYPVPINFLFPRQI